MGRKLVRNMKISDQGNAKNFNELYKIIMAMENNKNKVHTLVPFEKLVIEYPQVLFVGRMLINQEKKKLKQQIEDKLIADHLDAVNSIRKSRLDHFKKIEDRWIGSLNFVRHGEIAEKGAIFY